MIWGYTMKIAWENDLFHLILICTTEDLSKTKVQAASPEAALAHAVSKHGGIYPNEQVHGDSSWGYGDVTGYIQ